MKVVLKVLILALSVAFMAPAPSHALSRIKDIADFEGVRDNILIGYGLVVGLNGTGDTLTNSIFTRESLLGMLDRLGVNARNNSLKTKNVAAVMVTATLPAFAKQGGRIDVNIATLGDAKSLLGGTLLVTPLMGADGEVYAVSQGPIAIGGFSAEGQGGSVTQGVPTTGRIAGGAIVERELENEIMGLTRVKVSLKNPDFTTAARMSETINAFLGGNVSAAIDPATVEVIVPPQYARNTVAMLTEIEQLPVDPDQPAKVVIDEKSGVIVMGDKVRISTVAIAQGNLTIRITEAPQVSQPGAFAPEGSADSPVQTVTVPRTNIEVNQDATRRLAVMNAGVSLQQLVQGLNALGVGPRDLITIIQTIKAAGALQADIEVI